jgi:hypothetical protein
MIRYVKCPVMNPSGMHMSTFGPADDGNTYLMIRVPDPGTQAPRTFYSSYMSFDIGNEIKMSGWAAALDKTANTGLGEVATAATYSPTFQFRFLLLPINL